MTVRKHADWLSQTDERILELLAESGALHRHEIRQDLANRSSSLRRPAKVIEYRCSVLLTHGMIRRTDGGQYEICRFGEGFLEGRIDADNIAETKDRINDNGEVVGQSGDDEYWTCPDCRWIGTSGRLNRDAEDELVCPVCGNDTEFIT